MARRPTNELEGRLASLSVYSSDAEPLHDHSEDLSEDDHATNGDGEESLYGGENAVVESFMHDLEEDEPVVNSEDGHGPAAQLASSSSSSTPGAESSSAAPADGQFGGRSGAASTADGASGERSGAQRGHLKQGEPRGDGDGFGSADGARDAGSVKGSAGVSPRHRRRAAMDEALIHDEDRIEGQRVIAEFLSGCTCYDLTPESSKVVVFDRNIPIRLSYYALVEHEIGAAPLWDPLSQKLSGVITTLDFIEMLRYGHHTNSVLDILDSHSVASWRSLVSQLCESPHLAESLEAAGMPAVKAASMAAEKMLERRESGSSDAALLSINPDSSLYEACLVLKQNSAHWLPIVDVDEQICLGVLTHLAVLQHLVTNFVEDRRLFEQPISSLGIGTYATADCEIVSATLDTPVYKILDMLSVNCISCVPIVNAEGKPIAVYARTNVIDLVSHNSVENSLDVSLGSLIFGPDRFEGERESDSDDQPYEDDIPDRMRMHTCKMTDSLQEVFVKFAEVRVHRLLYVDDQGSLQGIVSLSDLLSYFVA